MKGQDQLQFRSWIEQVQRKDRDAVAPLPSVALDKLAAGELLDDAQANSLEAFVLKSARPALVVQDGRVETPPEQWRSLVPAMPMIERVSASVGRINVPGLRGLLFAGTGFLVGAELVMTTRLVAEMFATGIGTSGLAIRKDSSPSIDFRSEGGPESLSVPIVDVVLIHPFLDVALLRVPPVNAPPLTFSLESLDSQVGRTAIVVGHISYDPDRDLTVLTQIFGQVLGRKHVSPGVIGKPQIFASRRAADAGPDA